MNTTTIELQDWVTGFSEIARDFAEHHLRFDPSTPYAANGGPDASSPAVYVAILGERSSIHLGVSTSAEGCRALARAFLGLRGRDGISEREVVDGMSEILNILAGKVKSRMSPRDGSLKLGLPMYVAGAVGHGEGIERAATDVPFGPVPCRLLVFRQTRTT
jgi:hypothetical protein